MTKKHDPKQIEAEIFRICHKVPKPPIILASTWGGRIVVLLMLVVMALEFATPGPTGIVYSLIFLAILGALTLVVTNYAVKGHLKDAVNDLYYLKVQIDQPAVYQPEYRNWKAILYTYYCLLTGDIAKARIFVKNITTDTKRARDKEWAYRTLALYHYLTFSLKELEKLNASLQKEPESTIDQLAIDDLSNYLNILKSNKTALKHNEDLYSATNNKKYLFNVCIINVVNKDKKSFEKNQTILLTEKSDYYYYKLLSEKEYKDILELLK